MKHVYLVVRDTADKPEVVAVFTSKRRAIEFINKFLTPSLYQVTIEEFVLNPTNIETRR